MKKSLLPFLALFASLAVQSISRATVPTTRYTCTRAKGEIKIDGHLDDLAWKGAAWTGDFGDIVTGRKVALRTRVKMLWDERAWYIVAEITEPNVWATMQQHDTPVFKENAFEVFFDPDDDGKNYAEIEINPLGTIFDCRMNKPYDSGGEADEKWEAAGMKIAVNIDGTLNDPSDKDRGWTVEMAIPWSGLKDVGVTGPPREMSQWRVNFARVETVAKDAQSQYSTWSPQGAVKMHLPKRWGLVQWK
jgi:hypothetical protein